jgi:hypothetical protein
MRRLGILNAAEIREVEVTVGAWLGFDAPLRS